MASLYTSTAVSTVVRDAAPTPRIRGVGRMGLRPLAAHPEDVAAARAVATVPQLAGEMAAILAERYDETGACGVPDLARAGFSPAQIAKAYALAQSLTADRIALDGRCREQVA